MAPVSQWKTSMTDGTVVRCPACGQANRVPAAAAGKTVVCGNCKQPLTTGGHPVELTDTNFQSQIASGAVVVDFWAGWCGPCRLIGPIIDQLAAERNDVRFGKLNVDQNPRTSQKFGVQGIPLLIFFQDGVERGRVVGAVPRNRIEAAIQQYLG
jgi:thioredoxin 2